MVQLVSNSFCISSLILLLNSLGLLASFSIVPVIKNDANVNENYTGSVNISSPVTYIYEIKPQKERHLTTNTSYRLKANLAPAGIDTLSPDRNLSVTILQPNSISSSFQLPGFSKRGRNKKSASADSYYAERTLCILDGDPNLPMFISVILSTGSYDNISFSITITQENDFRLEFEESRNITVSALKPTYYNFPFSESGPQAVKIKADSIDGGGNCLTLSIQAPHCPIYDQEENVHYEGIYETISVSGTLTVKREEPFLEGFILVIVVHTSLDECLRRDPFSLPLPNIPDLSNWTGIVSAFSALRPFTPLSIDEDIHLSISIGAVDNGYGLLAKLFSWLFPNFIVLVIGCSVLLVFLPRRHKLMTKLLFTNAGEFVDEDDPILPIDISSQPEQQGNAHFENESRGILSQLRADKYLADFASPTNSSEQTLFRNGTAFFHHISIVAIFYCIPVFQFALYYFRVSKAIGNYDMCYYNYRCAHAEGPFIDFNHFISNAAYILFGIIFLIIVRKHEAQYSMMVRKTNRHQFENSNVTNSPTDGNGNLEEREGEMEATFVGQASVNQEEREDVGIPANFGLFMALGVALIVEGVLSAAYHLCPNQSTFQFDTCFMYVMSVLVLVKLYQFRHPRIFKP
ncbi:unnamed protein product [Orchesella dallaii]